MDYGRGIYHSVAINETIALSLGKKLYDNFCDQIKIHNNCNSPAFKKDFSSDFIEIHEDEYSMRDAEVVQNYSFQNIMKVLGQITE